MEKDTHLEYLETVVRDVANSLNHSEKSNELQGPTTNQDNSYWITSPGVIYFNASKVHNTKIIVLTKGNIFDSYNLITQLFKSYNLNSSPHEKTIVHPLLKLAFLALILVYIFCFVLNI